MSEEQKNDVDVVEINWRTKEGNKKRCFFKCEVKAKEFMDDLLSLGSLSVSYQKINHIYIGGAKELAAELCDFQPFDDEGSVMCDHCGMYNEDVIVF